jgi:MFS family permease
MYALTPILTVFAIAQIPGAGAAEVGISSMIYLVTSAIFTIPIGHLMDKLKGLSDELYMLTLSSVARGVLLFLLAFSTSLWSLYLIQFLIGISKAFNFTSWRVLFTKSVDNNKPGLQWASYDTIASIAFGLAAAVGGGLGDSVNYAFVIKLFGILAIIGGFMPLLVKKEIEKTRK